MRSRLVSTVTAITSGHGVPGVWAASAAPWAAPRSVDVEHEDAQPHRLARGPLHGIGDIVELENEEDLAPALAHGLDGGRTEGGEELGADLEARHLAGEGVDESPRAI